MYSKVDWVEYTLQIVYKKYLYSPIDSKNLLSPLIRISFLRTIITWTMQCIPPYLCQHTGFGSEASRS